MMKMNRTEHLNRAATLAMSVGVYSCPPKYLSALERCFGEIRSNEKASTELHIALFLRVLQDGLIFGKWPGSEETLKKTGTVCNSPSGDDCA
jgi:hypothetical protein